MPDPIARMNAALEGRYRIRRRFGEGGMASVYLAEDVRHGRKVALKLLKPELAAAMGADRFLAEIETTAGLQHPHILPLFDSGEADGLVFYVMPYVEGESLRDRLERDRQLPVDEAVRIAVRIAGALQYAHERDVIHRDIKPANILLSGGEPLVADFGIALAVAEAGGGRLTETGLSLGTPHYMSPEQAAGERTVDARSDVYALGSVLYEMLTGRPPHTGATAQAVLAAVLTTDPRPVTSVRRTVPAHVEAAILKALEKLPADRFTSAAEFARALEDPGFATRSGSGARPAAERRWTPFALTTAAGVVAMIGFVVGSAMSGSGPPPAVSAPAHLTLQLPPGVVLPMGTEHPVLALSPDGTRLVFVGEDGDGRHRLYLRSLADPVATPLAGTEGVASPFFSPDGDQVAFNRGFTISKVRLPGGTPEVAHAATGTSVNRGAAWLTGDTVIYAASRNSGLQQSSLAGPQAGAYADWDYITEDSTGAYAWPHALPDGRHLLFTETGGRAPDEFRVSVLSRSDRSVTTLIHGGTSPRYSRTAHVLFARGSSLYAVPFDVERALVTGPEVRVLDGVAVEPDGAAHFDLSDDGVLVYVRGGLLDRSDELVWVDRSGNADVAHDEGRTYAWPRISPDGRLVALTSSTGTNTDVWLLEPARGALQRVTTDAGEDFGAVWSPDARRLALSSEISKVDDGPGMAWTTVDGFEVESLLETPGIGNWEFPTSWSPDGRWIAFTRDRSGGSSDVEVFPVAGDSTPMPFAATAAVENGAVFSYPDGRWLAYVSDESGRSEVYVQPFPLPGRRLQVSTGGGVEPVWSRDGRELFYREGNAFLSVRVDATGDQLDPGPPVPLFEGRYEFAPYGARQANYDVSLDGRRFLMVRRKNLPRPTTVEIVMNWPAALLGERADDKRRRQ